MFYYSVCTVESWLSDLNGMEGRSDKRKRMIRKTNEKDEGVSSIYNSIYDFKLRRKCNTASSQNVSQTKIAFNIMHICK
jgi:hypothetical protein